MDLGGRLMMGGRGGQHVLLGLVLDVDVGGLGRGGGAAEAPAALLLWGGGSWGLLLFSLFRLFFFLPRQDVS